MSCHQNLNIRHSFPEKKLSFLLGGKISAYQYIIISLRQQEGEAVILRICTYRRENIQRTALEMQLHTLQNIRDWDLQLPGSAHNPLPPSIVGLNIGKVETAYLHPFHEL